MMVRVLAAVAAVGTAAAAVVVPTLHRLQVATAVPGTFTDQYGRIEWSRLGAAAGFVGVVFGCVLTVCLPLMRERIRAVQWGGKHGAATIGAMCEAIEAEPSRFRAMIASVFAPETQQRIDAHAIAKAAAQDASAIRTVIDDAKLVTTLPELKNLGKRLEDSMNKLAETIEAEIRSRARDRLSDREDFSALATEVRMITTANYHGTDRRHEERRHDERRTEDDRRHDDARRHDEDSRGNR